MEINDESRRAYTTGSNIKFETTMLRSSLCDYSDAYVLVKGNISVNNTAAADTGANNTNKKVIFKNYAPFTKYITRINNTDIEEEEAKEAVLDFHKEPLSFVNAIPLSCLIFINI